MKIIEILSSIFGVIMGVVFIYQSYKHLSLHGLMTKLVDKRLSTKTDQSRDKNVEISSINADMCPQLETGRQCVIHMFINNLWIIQEH